MQNDTSDSRDLDALYTGHLKSLMARTDAALAACGFDSLVIHSGSPLTLFLDDQDYPFKPNPHFKAWVPLDSPNCALLYRPGSKPAMVFHRAEDYWHKPAPFPSERWAAEWDIRPIADPKTATKFWSTLPRPAFIGPPEAFPDERESVNPVDLLTRLHYHRAVKTPYELECMRRANEAGARGHQAARNTFEAGGSEFDIQLSFLAACGQREQDLPYNNIVALNENSAVLHYQHLERARPPLARSFLIDAGAQFRGYASDITRTYAAAPGLYADLIAGVDEVQQHLCGKVRSGTDYRDIHLDAHRALGEVLHGLGVIDLPGADALECGLTRVFFPHGIGHLLGLQVHDVGGVLADSKGKERVRPKGHPHLRLTRMLEPGVVVTIEPGLYLIDSLLAEARGDERGRHIDWGIIETLHPFGGIRIEDDVAATSGDPENMTRNAFARIAA